jgi:leader peptidase (prepilin peptidase)/N-methyltransferase
MMPTVFAVFAFCLGAIIGSFLNACIHRMPRGLRLDEPKRSFCPSCNQSIRWYHNLPLVSWLWLRGRCGYCGAGIAFRYFLVELLTALGFLWIWLSFAPPVAVAYWVFFALLIVATFIDFEHYIIPDEITLGGAAAGVVASTVLPELMGQSVWWAGGLVAVGSAAVGYGSLWLVVEVGKRAFGKKRIAVNPAEPLEFQCDESKVQLTLGTEAWEMEEIFSRESDELVLTGVNWVVDGKPESGDDLRLRYDRWIFGGKEFTFDRPVHLSGLVNSLIIPREAMGFGDVKFMACIGAFLGWQALLFVIMVSSVVGAFVGAGTLLVTRGQSGGKIPYGPYLALGALAWIAVGPGVLDWYFGLLRPPNP